MDRFTITGYTVPLQPLSDVALPAPYDPADEPRVIGTSAADQIKLYALFAAKLGRVADTGRKGLSQFEADRQDRAAAMSEFGRWFHEVRTQHDEQCEAERLHVAAQVQLMQKVRSRLVVYEARAEAARAQITLLKDTLHATAELAGLAEHGHRKDRPMGGQPATKRARTQPGPSVCSDPAAADPTEQAAAEPTAESSEKAAAADDDDDVVHAAADADDESEGEDDREEKMLARAIAMSLAVGDTSAAADAAAATAAAAAAEGAAAKGIVNGKATTAADSTSQDQPSDDGKRSARTTARVPPTPPKSQHKPQSPPETIKATLAARTTTGVHVAMTTQPESSAASVVTTARRVTRAAEQWRVHSSRGTRTTGQHWSEADTRRLMRLRRGHPRADWARIAKTFWHETGVTRTVGSLSSMYSKILRQSQHTPSQHMRAQHTQSQSTHFQQTITAHTVTAHMVTAVAATTDTATAPAMETATAAAGTSNAPHLPMLTNTPDVACAIQNGPVNGPNPAAAPSGQRTSTCRPKGIVLSSMSSMLGTTTTTTLLQTGDTVAVEYGERDSVESYWYDATVVAVNVCDHEGVLGSQGPPEIKLRFDESYQTEDHANHSNDDGWFEVIGEGQVQVVAAIKLPAQGMVPTQMKQAPVHHTTKGDALSRLKKSARESVMVAICWKARKTGKALWVWYEVSDLSHNSKTATVKAVRTGQLGRPKKFELNYNKYGVPTEMVTKMGGAGVQGWVIDPRITPL